MDKSGGLGTCLVTDVKVELPMSQGLSAPTLARAEDIPQLVVQHGVHPASPLTLLINLK
jgi:hypothetical protein